MSVRRVAPRLIAITLTTDGGRAMIAFEPTRRVALFGLGAGALLGPGTAAAMCANPAEAGRWRNVDPKGDPALIDVRMSSCGDQVLNGEQTATRYKLRVWVLQSSGQFYGRPSVSAGYKPWKGQQWMVGKVSTGGYLDHLWMRADNGGGQKRLHVLIKHESLDSKPSANSEHWFRYEKPI
jgi:hypothetical protein